MINLSNDIELTQADKIFVDLIDDRITSYKQIPYTVPPKLIVEMIRESAMLFYRYEPMSNKTSFYRLDPTAILDFQKVETGNQNLQLRDIGKVVTLPYYVRVVKGVNKVNQEQISILHDAQISTSRSYSNKLYGIDSSLQAQQAAAHLVEMNAFKAVFDSQIRFHYNPYINQLEFYTDKQETLVLECYINLPIQYLYRNDLFIRHVIATTKRELKRVLGGHTIPLPGGATLNPEAICDNIEDAEKVETLIKQASGIGDIIMSNDD